MVSIYRHDTSFICSIVYLFFDRRIPLKNVKQYISLNNQLYILFDDRLHIQPVLANTISKITFETIEFDLYNENDAISTF